jgi:sugar lactone lactonase YvrE
MMQVFDSRVCALGEGALWHPWRKQLFWFDILGQKLLTLSPDGPQDWLFDQMVSAAGWVDRDNLLIASETALLRFDILSGASETIMALEADNATTRSNDGRADRQGGFWIGTMGRAAQTGAGAIYRYYKGELRKLFPGITIPNAICFAPDGGHAYFTDTRSKIIQRVALDAAGWPNAAPAPFIDLREVNENPDGAVVDAQGNLWVALWGAAQVAVFNAKGARIRSLSLAATQPTCPAFGGEDLTQIYCTSATQGLGPADIARTPEAGKTFGLAAGAKGLPETQVIL